MFRNYRNFVNSILGYFVTPLALLLSTVLSTPVSAQSYVFTNIADNAPIAGYPDGYYVPLHGHVNRYNPGFSLPTINQDGDIAFLGRVFQSDIFLDENRTVLQYKRSNGNTASLMNIGAVHLFGNTYRPFPIWFIQDTLDVNNSDEIAFVGTLDFIGRRNNPSTASLPASVIGGLFLYTPSTDRYRLIKPIGEGQMYTVGQPSLNDFGDVAYHLYDENSANRGYYINDRLIASTLFTIGDLAINISNYQDFFDGPTVAFWNYESEQSGDQSIKRGVSTLRTDAFDLNSPWYWFNNSSSFDEPKTLPGINDSGTIAFWALRDDAILDGIYIWDGYSLPQQVVNASSFGVRYSGTIGDRPCINNKNEVAFLHSPGGEFFGPFADFACYVYSNGSIRRVIGTNDALFGSRVKTLRFSHRHFNDDGHIAFYYELQNDRFGIALATPVTDPPTFRNVGANAITPTSATITWTTNLPADSRVEYGRTGSYGSSKNSSTLSTSHSVSLTGLTPSKQYHFRVHSTANGKTATSSDLTFVTRAEPPIVTGGDADFSYTIKRLSNGNYQLDIKFTYVKQGDFQATLRNANFRSVALGSAARPISPTLPTGGSAFLPPGGSIVASLIFPASAGSSGTTAPLRVQVEYRTQGFDFGPGSINRNYRVNLP